MVCIKECDNMSKKNLNLTYEELEQKIKEYIVNEEELNVIRKAYQLATEKHFGVKRLTGEDYIQHPLNVAYILTDMKADYLTLAASLLHDVIEDTDMTKEDLENEFGKEIASLVDGVTKINKLNFETTNAAVIANQRKILVGLCEDVRVIFIKLADRLHNMRTLWVHTEKKQKEKALETLEILTPIAHRLGMNAIKSELEDLSLRYLKPEVYFDIVEKLNQTKAERDDAVLQMQKNVSEILNKNGIPHKIKGRAKSIYSIYKKLDKGKKFEDIYDLLALRVFVDTKEECYHALGLIHSKYHPIPNRFKDYIAMPKTNMYQSLHTTVFGYDGYLYEIQIRTYEMDEIAERGIASHWSYKEGTSGNIQNSMEQKLQFFRSIMELNQEQLTDEEYIKNVTNDVFNDTIYVYTPKGDVIELPNGSTPIDFAYRVHSKVGDTMIGAIVNNNIVPLDYKLQDNDIIKINTNKNSSPSYEWINIAYTAGAKSKIRAYFKRIDKEEYLKQGEELLTKELKKKKISISEFLSEENVNKILDETKCSNLEELYVSIGNNKIAPYTVIHVITGENETKEDLILKKVSLSKEEIPVVKNDIIVGNIDDIKINVASCCKPIPGDEIIGYITKGYGINVHRKSCPNVEELQDRIIDVKWNTEINKKYPTSIIVKSLKNDNLLLDIISKTQNGKVNIQKVNTITESNQTVISMTVLVEDKNSLQKFMNDIQNIPNILSIERVIK